MGRYRLIQRGTPEELAPLRDDETWVRVWCELPDEAWRTVAAMFVDRPDLALDVEHGEDLEMLRWFPGLRRLGGRSLRLRSLDGLRHVATTLEVLSVGDTLRPVSLRPAACLAALRELFVNGTWRDLDTIGRLTTLDRLGIGSIDLELLRPLASLRRFTSGLGTVRSFELLPEIGDLEYLELYRLRGSHDLAPLARMRGLCYLVLQSTSSITSLPSFRDSPALRWVVLDTMKGIRDIRPVAEAANLEVLMLIGMGQLEVDDLRPLVGHPALKAAVWGLDSQRKNAAAAALLPLPPPPRVDEPLWTGVAHPNAS